LAPIEMRVLLVLSSDHSAIASRFTDIRAVDFFRNRTPTIISTKILGVLPG